MPIWFWILFALTWFPVGAIAYRFGRPLISHYDLDFDNAWIWYKRYLPKQNPSSFRISVVLGYLSFAGAVLMYVVAAIFTIGFYFVKIGNKWFIKLFKLLAGYKG